MDLSSVPMPAGTFTIGKTFDFEGGHRLPGLPPEHKCSRQHGHSYEVEVILTAPSLEEPGFVTDFGALAPFRKFVGTEASTTTTFPRDPPLRAVLGAPGPVPRPARHPERPAGGPRRLVAVRIRETGRSWARFDVEGQ